MPRAPSDQGSLHFSQKLIFPGHIFSESLFLGAQKKAGGKSSSKNVEQESEAKKLSIKVKQVFKNVKIDDGKMQKFRVKIL